MTQRPPIRTRGPKRLPSASPTVPDPDSAAESSTAVPQVSTAPFSASTGTLASALLRPIIRADEAREYDAWLSQFSHISPTGHDYLSDKDRVVYETYVRRLPASVEPSTKDRSVYESFVATGEAGALVGSVNDIAIPPASTKMYRELVQGEKWTD